MRLPTFYEQNLIPNWGTNVIGIIDNILIRRVAFMIVHCAVPFFFIVSSYFLSIKDFSNWGVF